jgi:IclR family acetate operon transcriptional repressor
MVDLRHSSGETVNLALFRGGRLVYVDIVEGNHALRMSGSVGEEVPLHSTALGKATLAALPVENRRSLLGKEPYPSYTNRTYTTWEQLNADLKDVEARGYAVDLEEMDFGAACVAAAILGTGGHPVGALSVAGLAARFSSEDRKTVGELVAKWCKRINQDFEKTDRPVRVVDG